MLLTSNFCYARASECRADADRANLSNVRERCERSEAAWLQMADGALRRETKREKAGEAARSVRAGALFGLEF